MLYTRAISSRIQREVALGLLCVGFTAARAANSWGSSASPECPSCASVWSGSGGGTVHVIHTGRLVWFCSEVLEVKSRAEYTLGRRQALRAGLSVQRAGFQVKTVSPRFWRCGPLFTTKWVSLSLFLPVPFCPLPRRCPAPRAILGTESHALQNFWQRQPSLPHTACLHTSPSHDYPPRAG